MPGIVDGQAAALEIGHIARGQAGTAAQRDGGDLAVELRDRPPGTAPGVHHLGVGGRRGREAGGGEIFRGGAFKPRSSPYSFQGLGEEGLRLLRAGAMEGRPYALAFVDMRMPAGWDGVRTIEELWREDSQLQVVICTAYSDNPLENALSRLGSPDRLLVLKKPFDPIEVIQMARA